MEMTLRNGKVKIWKDTQFGPATGDPRAFKTYEELWAAYQAQLLNLVKHVMIQLNVAVTLGGERRASPVNSMVFKLSMESGMDLHQHGRGIPNAVDIGYVETAGKSTVIDSLAAIKHLVFDTKKLTWDQLLTAMDANWEGHEAIRQLCLNAPKFGNGIEWVDQIGWEIEDVICRYLKDNPRPNGQCFVFRQVPVTMHVPFGKATAATPNGRHAGDFLSEGISPSHGCDVKGPTVAIQSMARGRAGNWGGLRGPDLANMKFSPATIAGEEGTQRLMQIIRVWSSSKLWHIQFNILNRETLLAAQKDPEKYRNLIVRIAGYSAYFVDLSPAQQSEILARTEQER
jgi:formate C-acetyltransferase